MHPGLIETGQCALLVIDMQETLLAIQHNRQNLMRSCNALLQAANLLHIPVLATTQNAPRLGPLLPEIEALLNTQALDKMTFGALADARIREAVQQTQRTQWVICGVETHICVCQTAMQMQQQGLHAWAATDAVSARSAEKHQAGLHRINQCGIALSCTESILYEWLGEAGTPAFRALHPLLKTL